MKKVLGIYSIPDRDWVGDGFPVRTLFSYDTLGHRISPFLLLDFAGPAIFQAATTPCDVGQHPHRGFETVTIVYEGEMAHRDSTGQGGVIGPDDVQWMTAAGSILHEELPSSAFTRSGGPFRMVQLWINLLVKDKTSPPKYQSILDTDIPSVDLPQGAGRARVIAGDFGGVCGPARTFAPINVWGLSSQCREVGRRAGSGFRPSRSPLGRPCSRCRAQGPIRGSYLLERDRTTRHGSCTPDRQAWQPPSNDHRVKEHADELENRRGLSR